MADLQIIDREWLTISEASALIGKSYKTVDRLAKADVVRTRMETRSGRKPEKLYSAIDIQRAKDEAITAPSKPVRTDADTQAVRIHQPIQRPDTSRSALALAGHVQTRPTVRIERKLWLRLSEAAAYSGLPQALLVQMRKEGHLPALKTGAGYRYRRADLESFAG